MSLVSIKGLSFVCILLALVVCSGYVGAADINEKIGDRINLKGSAVGADSIYLFVTGPGLPSDGVRLDTMQIPVITGDPGSFTVTDVTNDNWAYTWNTARQGFVLKEGIYTVYAVKQPVGKTDVKNAVYGTITVSLTKNGEPYSPTGTVVFDTTPVDSEIFLDGQSVGLTPQTRGVPAGDHVIRFEHPGYQTIIEQLSVTPGTFITIQRTMILEPTRTITTSVATSTLITLPLTTTVTQIIPATTKRAPVSVPIIIISVSAALFAFGLKGRINKKDGL
jgi:hypothetical protein